MSKVVTPTDHFMSNVYAIIGIIIAILVIFIWYFIARGTTKFSLDLNG